MHNAQCTTSFSNVRAACSGVSPIITLVVGHEQRIFAAHEDVLTRAPYFANILKYNTDGSTKRIALPDESPEIFSSVLEFLYKADYYPRLVHSKRRNSWELEPTHDGRGSKSESTVYHHGAEGPLLKDTVIYCAAEKYGLEELKRVALRKQGLREFAFTFPFEMVTFHPPSVLTHPSSKKKQITDPRRNRIRYSMQHHPLLCSLRLLSHARHRLQTACSLPRPHHSQPLHIQTKRNDAA